MRPDLPWPTQRVLISALEVNEHIEKKQEKENGRNRAYGAREPEGRPSGHPFESPTAFRQLSPNRP